MRSRYIPFMLLTGALLAACGSYRQNILFKVDPAAVQKRSLEAETNYVIQVNDFLTFEVYTNQGEKIVDPNRESFKQGNATATDPAPLQYLVDVNGMVKLPLLDKVRLQGLTIHQAEEMLEKAYEEFYKDAYVTLKFTNKRVIVLGAPGGQVIPLQQENMRLTEVLALAKGLPADGKANNIRVIRQDKIFLVDLTTFQGYQNDNLVMQPGDIVYVEPVRRPFIEGLRDYSPAINIVTGLATLIFIIYQVDK